MPTLSWKQIEGKNDKKKKREHEIRENERKRENFSNQNKFVAEFVEKFTAFGSESIDCAVVGRSRLAVKVHCNCPWINFGSR